MMENYQPTSPEDAQAISRMELDHERRVRLQQEARQLTLKAYQKAIAELRQRTAHLYDLSVEAVYQEHANLVMRIANEVVLEYQHRPFIVDDNNRDVLRYLLYYFNNCPLAESVFPGRGYKNHKHLMLMGEAGCGKTLLMQIISEYLRLTGNPNFFYNLSVTQMVNYYTLHNNLDRYTYNEESGRGFHAKPVNICLNDIGVQTTTFYGMDTNVLTNEFLHARNEIWANYHMKAHVTTNLTLDMLREKYADGFNRLIDRFKTYNIIPLPGQSRR